MPSGSRGKLLIVYDNMCHLLKCVFVPVVFWSRTQAR